MPFRKSTTLRVALAGVLFAACVAPGVAGPEDAEQRWAGILPDPGQARLDDDDPRPEYFVCRILDAETGAPIPGATWVRTPEWIAPWRLRHDAVLSVGVADEEGIAHVPATPAAWKHDCHWLVQAPGYAPAHEYATSPESEVLLERGVPFRGRLLDPLGRPVVGGVVETLGGCSHGTASARSTVAADGSFLVERVPAGLPGQVWVEGPGIAADLLALDTPDSLGGNEVVLVMDPGARFEGRVLDLLGRPIQGVVVRAYNEQRGPTAMAGADGRFVLEGAEPDHGLFVYPPADLLEGDGERNVDDAHPGVPLTIVVGPTGVQDEEESARLRIRAVDVDGAPVGGVSVAALRIATGRGPTGWTADEEPDDADEPALGTAEEDVVPGTYRVVPDEPFGGHVFEPVDVPVAAGETADVVLHVREQPRLRIEGELPDDVGLVLAVPGAVTSSALDGEEWAPPLPAEGVAVLRVELDGRPPFLFPVGPAADGLRRVVVSLPQARRIVPPSGARYLRLLDGERTAYHAVHDGVVTTDASGRLTLHWLGADDVDYEADVDVPDTSGATVRVDPAAVRRTPDASERVAIERDGWRTVRVVTSDPDEADVRYGSATLRLRIEDEDGEPCDAVALVAGEVYAAPEGVLELRGFEAGTVRVLVGHRDEVGPGRELRLELKADEVCERTVTLTVE